MAQRKFELDGYKTIQCLGNGARSTVWLAQDQKSKTVVIKHTTKRDGEDNRFLEQAINEYDIASQLKHPTIRQVYELKKLKSWFKLVGVVAVMEYCEGKSIQDNRPQSVAENCRIFSEVAKAISSMNKAGYVHADMKPNNIIVAPKGTIKVIDLGQSCHVGTIKQRIQGTPDYIAPEQVQRHPLDGRTDVFNFGATMYWSLTGKPIPTVIPQSGSLGSGKQTMATPPDKINPDIPPALSKLIMECIEHAPNRRPKSMDEVIAKLDAINQKLGKPVAAPAARTSV